MIVVEQENRGIKEIHLVEIPFNPRIRWEIS